MCSVRFVNTARQIGVKTDFMIGEFATLAYGTRAFPELGKVELSFAGQGILFFRISRQSDAIDASCRQADL